MSYEQTTNDISIRVRPQYMEMDSDPASGRYLWTYTVEINNGGPYAMQVLRRFWQITDSHGHMQQIEGKGVIGKQPVIEPGGTFSYTSGTPLTTPSGMMGGRYQMRDDNGILYDITIPTFSLDSPHDPARVH